MACRQRSAFPPIPPRSPSSASSPPRSDDTLDLEEEDVEDLKLALTEVCSAAIEAATGDHDVVTVEVGWSADPVELDVHVVSSSRFSTGDPGSSDRAGLLDALGVELRGTDDGRGVAFAPTRGASA